jgi:argininosuccinate synthase
VTFEEGAVDYDHADAHGFIRLNALRLRVREMVNKGKG